MRVKEFICTSCFSEKIPCKVEITTGIIDDIQSSDLQCIMSNAPKNKPEWKESTNQTNEHHSKCSTRLGSTWGCTCNRQTN